MNKAEKSLRWVVNQIPDLTPKTNEEKMLVAIKLYSEAGAEEIKRLEAENAALRNEADENAALSMENKMRADRLEKENAALRERLGKAIELPCIEPMTTWDWNEETGIGEEHFGDYYQFLYRNEEGD